ncbi:MAG: phosphatidylglycerol lysyltransferase domain-containing protein, partial [Oscillospiraceae bacterium]|nr:phosphatidylglycerol lysyltransferase domain-containing protein [Oscillospiraceae bacterium]
MDFEPIALPHLQAVREAAGREKTRNSDFGFINLWAWRASYKYDASFNSGSMLVRFVDSDGGYTFSYPLGAENDEHARELIERAGAKRFAALNPRQLEAVNGFYPGRVTSEPQTDLFDYVYDIGKLADVSGKKLHNKRTHVRRFEENNPGYNFELVTKDNIGECILAYGIWISGEDDEAFDTIPGESHAFEQAVLKYHELNLLGGLLRVDGSVAAFSIGEILSGDTFVTHFEKAVPELNGAYQVINRDFARLVREEYPAVRYINREDDMGLPGLRQAKRSYYPEIMEEKWRA